jgi:hypothetical protein
VLTTDVLPPGDHLITATLRLHNQDDHAGRPECKLVRTGGATAAESDIPGSFVKTSMGIPSGADAISDATVTTHGTFTSSSSALAPRQVSLRCKEGSSGDVSVSNRRIIALQVETATTGEQSGPA